MIAKPPEPTAAKGKSFKLRIATSGDIEVLRGLIDRSVRGLQHLDYSPEQIDAALRLVYGVDTQLIADGTYFVVEVYDDRQVRSEGKPLIVGCGGWSKRKTLYGGDHCDGRENNLLDPLVDAAKIRAFFIDPNWSRLGIGSMILHACETAALASGFTAFEMGATLTGVALYQARGYHPVQEIAVPLENGLTLPVVRMTKAIS
ncbi:MAG: GNAT family N-acetyltransferase [Cyanobacteria bacterium REEB67]|nr:GNAT family N-acetyltransferase [Cyanobacteria bacterium REEB67]